MDDTKVEKKMKLADIPPADPETAAERFKALGDPTRLKIIQYLYCLLTEARTEAVVAEVSPEKPAKDAAKEEDAAAVAPPPGSATVNDICRHVTGKDKQTSTFSHHLKELRQVGLLIMQKGGKTRLYRLDPAGLAALLPYLGGGPPAPKKRSKR
jgi:DNA-binding transcriptional ArsR family regulator